ncbi:MAG: NAD(P)-dependent oxidoreductase [Peptoniphilaceae bacterium]|nr:NAD(P)-binding domain-containing protein [Peptoniphilaceae bacterium]MDD7383564.1 NAD(P)-dependent oxidoreductase [Peptoniphilaceae bacterium]MDY3738737.1 NAD(P)-dependent oxidoreductase [Peptoniphilaceae bacterium]
MKITLIDPLTVNDELVEEQKNKLEKMGHEFEYYKESANSDDEIIERLKKSDVAIITNKKFSKKVVDNTNLKLIDVAFTGVDHVAVESAKEKGIVVENASGYSDISVAELVFGMIISILRKFKDNRENLSGENNDLLGETLNGKKVGVIGTGKIGQRVIKLLSAFGAQIIAYNRTEKQEMKDMGVKYVTLDELLSTSDIVTVHLPLNDSTKGFLNSDKLNLIKKDSILINCARGPIIDNDALADLLNEGKIRAAGIDVFDMEPPLKDDYKLKNAKNVLITNHIAYYTKEAMVERANIVFDNLYKFLDGKIQNEVK